MQGNLAISPKIFSKMTNAFSFDPAIILWGIYSTDPLAHNECIHYIYTLIHLYINIIHVTIIKCATSYQLARVWKQPM